MERLLDRAAVLVAFEQIGGAQAALEMAREYALGRFAFGRQIASFQAIKHKLADMYVGVELARSNAYYGAWALTKDAPELPVAAAAARVAASEAYYQAAKENIQIHGGMGFTWEFDCHLHYRRAKLTGLMLGSARRWKDLLVSRLEARRRLGETSVDFDDTREEAAFRAEVARVARRAAPSPSAARSRRGRAATRAATATTGSSAPRPSSRKKAEAGFAALHWPAEWGGRALPADLPGDLRPGGVEVPGTARLLRDRPRHVHADALRLRAPRSQKRRYAPAALRGDEVWCQLFSEPGAGSDLAGLRTRAQRDGDDWVINGQKIWTSGAHWADWAILVARSDPKAPKHKGLTFFFLDMKSPGIETRRIKQISGASHFNEVYFTDVRIPDSQRLGEVGAGWGVAITTLMNERLTSGDLRGPDFEEIFGLARATPLEDGPAIANAAVRERLADLYVKTQGVRLTRFRTMTALSRGETPGPENSIGKLVNAPKAQEIASFAMDLLDMGGVMMDKDLAPLRAAFQESLLSSPGGRIAAGTDEILRNIIAERVLGLPQDVRVDRELPFDQLPSGSRAV